MTQRLHVRVAGPLDAGALADMMSARPGPATAGGTVSRQMLAEWMTGTARSLWHLAEDDEGRILGVQWIDPRPAEPRTAEIATVARQGPHQARVGSALFEATRAAAAQMNYRAIWAEIPAQNAGARAFYQSRGFEARPGTGPAGADMLSMVYDLTR